MNRLQGKHALITGGTTGIGLETVRQFLEEGARVAATGSHPSRLEDARKQLPDAVWMASDAGDAGAQRALAEAVGKALGKLDVLFVNAGVVDMRPLENWDEKSFDRSLDILLKGPFFLIRELLPLFANPASIILNASINAHIGMPNSSVYSAGKAALLSLARTLSGELIARGIRVNAISCGPIETPLYDKIGMPRESAASEALKNQVPARRFGQPAEVAKAVVFLASDETAFAVGSELIIDGGMSTL
ncbi:MAG TPA: SDR family oxidoreductase [Bryobacteraceae bacterium]|jgi:NAD(P)-dependent dehydrogenase (short-subunit alcohol dehydrogenase family)|nr:SDR family oxidoreductase [Bryobacteraceae bacterium]